jgi:hypothetical protein
VTTKVEGDSSASADQIEDVNAAISSEAEDGQQEANQSTDVNDAGASSDAGEDGKSAKSSPAEGDKEPKSLLEAVQAASKKEAEAEKSPGSEGGQEKAKPAPDEDTDESEEDGTGELSEKELAALKPKTRKRMEFLSGQLGALRPKAEAMDQLVRYVEEANLQTDEVNKGFEIMRLMKSNPFEALQQLRPYINTLLQITGEQLPAQLQNEVNQGLISEQHARTLVQQATRTQLANDAATRASDEAKRIQTEHSQTTHVNEVATAVSEWENKWAASDPDYKAKQSLVQEKIELGLMRLRNSGQPITRQAVLKLANESKTAVEAQLKSFTPRKQQVNPIPNGQGSAQATPQPKTMLEAVRMAARGS